MCAYDHSDSYNEFVSEREHTAKKEHRCGECRRIIHPNEKYKIFAGKWDGDFFTYKMCSHCQISASLLIRECGGWVFSAIIEDIEEHIGYNYPWERDARRLVAGMRKKWMFNGKLLNIPQLKTKEEKNESA